MIERLSSVIRATTLATEPSVQLDLKSGTICRWTSDSRTCHMQPFQTVAEDVFIRSVEPKCSANLHFKLRFRNALTYLLTYLSLKWQNFQPRKFRGSFRWVCQFCATARGETWVRVSLQGWLRRPSTRGTTSLARPAPPATSNFSYRQRSRLVDSWLVGFNGNHWEFKEGR